MNKTDEQWASDYNTYLADLNDCYPSKAMEAIPLKQINVLIDIMFELKKIAHELKRSNAP